MFIKIRFRDIHGQLDIYTGETFFYGCKFPDILAAIKKYEFVLDYRAEIEYFENTISKLFMKF